MEKIRIFFLMRFTIMLAARGKKNVKHIPTLKEIKHKG